MIILVFGGRNYNNWDEMCDRLHRVQMSLQDDQIDLFIHGGAPGADQLSGKIARGFFGVPDLPFYADWENVTTPGAVIKHKNGRAYNAIAGHWRNQRMLDAILPNSCAIGFPGGTGTADMLARVKRKGMRYINAGAGL